MKQFYKVFSDEKVSPMATQLSWSNCRLLLSIKDYNEINYYINQIKKCYNFEMINNLFVN